MCGACGAEFAGEQPQFFLPIPNRTKGTEPSKRVCPDCFVDFLRANAPEGIEAGAINHDDFYHEASHAGDIYAMGADE